MAGFAKAVFDSDFENKVLKASHEKPVLVDFWADWCGPCKMLSPLVEQLAEENNELLQVVKMDVDANNETAGQFNIMSIPTLILFKDGAPVKQLVGYMPKERILSQLTQFLDKGKGAPA